MEPDEQGYKGKVVTCLWFDGVAEPAVELYTSLIPGSAITSGFFPEPGAAPLLVEFHLAGVPYLGLNGGPGSRIVRPLVSLF